MEQQPVMKSISESLGMNPLVIAEEVDGVVESTAMVVHEEPELTKEEKEAEEDFQEVRERVKDALEVASEALTGLAVLAQASEHPRAYEVVANLVKTITEGSKNLLDLHEKRHQITPVKAEEAAKKDEAAQITNNNVFVGTTAELLELIKAGKNPYANTKVIDG